MQVWVEMCRRGRLQTLTLFTTKTAHFDILFKNLFHDPDTFCSAIFGATVI